MKFLVILLAYSAITNIQGCTDTFPRCSQLRPGFCSDPNSADWNVNNCAAFCGLCPPPQCSDAFSRCSDYTQADCTKYQLWMSTHCKKFCGLCNTPTPSPSPTPKACADAKLDWFSREPNCEWRKTHDGCIPPDDTYKDYMRRYCQGTCGFTNCLSTPFLIISY